MSEKADESVAFTIKLSKEMNDELELARQENFQYFDTKTAFIRYIIYTFLRGE